MQRKTPLSPKSKIIVCLFTGACLVLGLMHVTVAQLSSSASVNVHFTIAVGDYIWLEVLDGEDVYFGMISDPGTYLPAAGTRLELTSNRPWDLNDSVLFDGSSTYPDGADTVTMDTSLARAYTTAGDPGIHQIDVAYQLDLTQEDLDNLPNGPYILVVQFTATTTGT
jgi:hypothetical protein